MAQRWLVVVNDTPVRPESPLDLGDVIDHFRDQVDMSDPDDRDRIEIRVADDVDHA